MLSLNLLRYWRLAGLLGRTPRDPEQLSPCIRPITILITSHLLDQYLSHVDGRHLKAKHQEKEKKSKSSGCGSQKSQTECLKTVARPLLPNLPEDVFWQSVGKWVSEETVSWRAYYPGKFKTRYVLASCLVFGAMAFGRC